MAISNIHISFPTPVEISEECQRFLDEALTAICEDYELSNPSRVMWVFGVGGTPPPGFMFDEPRGEWDMTTLNFEITERERYEGETTTQHSDLRRVFHERDKFRDQVIDTCKRAERAEKANRDETGWQLRQQRRLRLGAWQGDPARATYGAHRILARVRERRRDRHRAADFARHPESREVKSKWPRRLTSAVKLSASMMSTSLQNSRAFPSWHARTA